MTDFDPYHDWLGIPAEEQPPNHYRLLGVKVYEASDVVISNAADRQMTYLRQLQAGPHQIESQKLLNEIAAARLCLLNPVAKASYDASLRKATQPTSPTRLLIATPLDEEPKRIMPAAVRPVVAPDVGTPHPITVSDTTASSSLSKARRLRRRRPTLVRVTGHGLAAVMGLSLGWLILQWIRADRVDAPIAQNLAEAGMDRPEPEQGDTSEKPPASTPAQEAEPANDPFNLENDSSIPSTDRKDESSPDSAGPSIVTKAEPEPETPTTETVLSPSEQLEQLKGEIAQALSAGNLARALAASGKIAALEEADAMLAKLATLIAFREAAPDADAMRTLAQQALRVFDEAQAQGRSDVAVATAELALLAARESKDSALVRRATLGVLKVQLGPSEAEGDDP